MASCNSSSLEDREVLLDHMVASPLTIGQSRLYITMLPQLPSTFRGNPTDGAEYHYCCNEDCGFLWATQWKPQPRKRIGDSMDLSSYKQIAIPKLCCLCKAALKEPGIVGEAARHMATQQTKQNGRLSEKSPDEASEEKKGTMSTAGFEDIPLGEPAEGADKTFAKELSWDVVEESDANEEWSVINHFGSAAIEHKDAHVDTELVRP